MRGFLTWVTAYLGAPRFLWRHRLWHYQFLPAFLSLVLSAVFVAGIIFAGDAFAGWVDSKVEFEPQWLDTALTLSVQTLVTVASLFAFVFLHKHIVLVVLAPFLARLSENVARVRMGKPTTPAMQPLDALKRSAIINTRSVLGELSLTVMFLLGGLVLPVVSPVTSTLIFLTQSRFAGAGLSDFALEFRGYDVKQSVQFNRQRRALATGLGVGYLVLMLIPIIGWMLAPTLGTVAGTVATLDDLPPEPPPEPEAPGA